MNNNLWEPNFDRMVQVLDRQGEPDRVPFFELFHDAEIIEAVMGEPTPGEPAAERRYRINFMTRLGYDYVVGYHTVAFTYGKRPTADDTALYARRDRTWRAQHHGMLETWEDFERYPWPRVDDASFNDIEALAPMLPEGMKVTTTLPGGVLENLIDTMGYENLCLTLIDTPELVQAVADRIGQCLLAVYEKLVQYDHVAALWLNDDLGFKTQTMIGPEHLRQYVFPWHRKLTAYAHEHRKFVLLHACGDLREVIEDLIDHVRIDAKHSFEDVIQPVAEFKELYGDRIAVLGGIDVDVLARQPEEEVRRYTRQVIEQCAPGGGWALGSGNSVANYIPVQNFLAMLDEGRKLGGV